MKTLIILCTLLLFAMLVFLNYDCAKQGKELVRGTWGLYKCVRSD